MVIGGISEVANGIGNLAPAVAKAKRMNDSTSHEHEAHAEGETLNNIDTTITFTDVTFSYGEDLPLALDNASFNITPGSRVAFTGGSGSGKSTILKLLMGLYDPTEGQILIGGKDITVLSRESLRNVIAYVPQDSFLLPGRYWCGFMPAIAINLRF